MKLSPFAFALLLGGASVLPHTSAIAAVGASVPWTTYEAESGSRPSSATLITGTSWGNVPNATNAVAFEARGKKAVVLDGSGEYVQWTNVVSGNRLLVRYSLPDNGSGSLNVYLNGSSTAAATFNLSSAKMRETGKPEVPGGTVPFYDEAMVAVNIPANATVKIQRASGSVTLDFMEVETAPAALSKPDSTWIQPTAFTQAALVSAISTANSGSKKVWLGAGTYTLNSQVVIPSGIQIRGAGIFHTTIVKNWVASNARAFRISGSNNVMRDFKAVDTMTTLVGGNCIIDANDSTNCTIQNVWSEYASLCLAYRTTGLTVRNCRVRNGYKDSIHVASHATGALLENNSFRNTGDDCCAFVSYGSTVFGDHIARNNTAELTIGAARSRSRAATTSSPKTISSSTPCAPASSLRSTTGPPTASNSGGRSTPTSSCKTTR